MNSKKENENKMSEGLGSNNKGKVPPDIIENNKNVTVVKNANVQKLNWNIDNNMRSITSVLLRGIDKWNKPEDSFEITAGAYVLCCGCLENTKILLNSDLNHSSHVGKYLKDHLICNVADVTYKSESSMLYTESEPQKAFYFVPKQTFLKNHLGHRRWPSPSA